MEKTVHFIMYHYVRDLKNSEYPTIKGLDKELFEKQLAYLLEHYTPVRMDEILAAYQKNDFSDIPENGFVLTFDDGYIDHWTKELHPDFDKNPSLQNNRLPAVSLPSSPSTPQPPG